MKNLLLLAILFSAFNVLGQDTFVIFGKLETSDEPYGNITICRDDSIVGNLVDVYKFNLELDFEKEYKIEFNKPGYTTKELYVNTKLPDDIYKDFMPLGFWIVLDTILNVEINKVHISYNKELDDFDFYNP